MCDGKEGFARDGITYMCCYNHYFNGFTCVRCLAGFYGNDCLKKCANGFYGERCSNVCKCSAEQICHHKTGCIIKYNGSSQKPLTSFENSTDYASSNSKSPLLALTSTLPTTIQFPLQTNIFIFAIGSLISLFFGIIAVQFCIKLCIKRRKYSQQMSIKRNPVKEEETYNYHEINESLMGIEGNVSRHEQRHVGKYDELHTSNQLTGVPYDKIRTHAQYQDVTESLVESPSNSDSSNNNTSYLEPKTNEGLSYINDMESSNAESGMIIQNSHVNTTNNRNRVTPQYLDPVHDIHNDEIVLQCHDLSDNNNAYLDVTHDTFI